MDRTMEAEFENADYPQACPGQVKLVEEKYILQSTCPRDRSQKISSSDQIVDKCERVGQVDH